MQRILVPMTGTDVDRHVLDIAFRAVPNGHFDVRLFRNDPAFVPAGYGDGYSGEAIAMLIDAAEERGRTLQTTAQSTFEDWLRREKIAVSVPALGPNDQPSANFEDVVGAISVNLTNAARVVDLVVVSREQDQKAEQNVLISTALFESGRPVLLVPEGDVKDFTDHIAVAWDRSREAARAVGMAMPLLLKSKEVTVITLKDAATQDIDPAVLSRTLNVNGISATPVNVDKQDRAELDVFKAEVARAEARMIVMGAYSHTRLREIIFGGMTREILKDFPTPVLLVH